MIVDAYMHGGRKRFCDGAENLAWMDRHDVDYAVWVHGPFIPDLQLLKEALTLAPDRVRCVGVPMAPWQGDEEKARAVVDEMLALGAIGFRLQGDEYLRNDYLLTAAGEQGRWLYAINPHDRPEFTHKILEWLEAYPQARVLLPHYLHSDLAFLDRPGMEQLLAHPRVFAVFSRHGGAGKKTYPHEDLFPWARAVIERMGESRICWGSEFPVYLWRNENFAECRDWWTHLPAGLIRDREAFLAGRAKQWLFDETPFTPSHTGKVLELSYDGYPIPLNHFALDPLLYPELMRAYAKQPETEALPFFEFINHVIKKGCCD